MYYKKIERDSEEFRFLRHNESSDRIIKIQNCMYFSKNKKIRKKVLTFAFGGVIITKLSARATVNEFF